MMIQRISKMFKNNLKTLAGRAVEIAGAVLLAIFCFMLFLFILKLIFPSGTSLSEMMKGTAPRQETRMGEYSQGEYPRGEQPEPFAASISWYFNSVKAKSSRDIAWSDVREGMLLYNRDAVQTARQSSAAIAFDAANSLEMSSNSLVIIKTLTKDKAHKVRKSVLLVIDGELRGKLSGSANDVVQVEMALPAGIVQVQTQKSADGKEDFTARVNPDKSSTISVRHGIAEVTAQGKTVRVGANLFTTVSLTGPPTTPRALPAAPALDSPSDEASFTFRDLPPKIRFTWQGPTHVKNFRLQLASDPEFKKVVVDEKVGKTGFSHGNLRQAKYFWKVSSLDGWSEGDTSPARSFNLVRDFDPPPLQVEFPPPMLESRQYLLKGTTEAGAELFINNKRVSIGNTGDFTHLLELQRGINVIIVEAVDAAGNITCKTHKVISKF
jgi:hypothetical protein